MNNNIETRSEATFTDILIVGAGFGGLGMGIQLKRRGEDAFVILERADDVGAPGATTTIRSGLRCALAPVLFLVPHQPKLVACLLARR